MTVEDLSGFKNIISKKVLLKKILLFAEKSKINWYCLPLNEQKKYLTPLKLKNTINYF